VNATLAERLKWARKRAGLTQQQVAEAAGMTQPAYSDLESARSKSSALTASLADALKVSALWLERGVGTPEQPVAIRETAPTYRDGVNESELAVVIDAVETWLAESKRSLAPADKASLVASLYRMLPTALEEGDRLVKQRSTVVSLLEVVNRAGTNAQGTEGPVAFGAPGRKPESKRRGRRAAG
jgi:transcriptional regulator with XRE-family HTH domain